MTAEFRFLHPSSLHIAAKEGRVPFYHFTEEKLKHWEPRPAAGSFAHATAQIARYPSMCPVLPSQG